jgi:hypothetical protein
MALSPADFAAYSRATGTPYPEDPEERAELAPEVLEFRRNQLRAPQEESNLPGILGAVAASLGAAGAGYAGLRYLAGRPKSQAAQTGLGVNKTDLSNISATRVIPAPSRIADPSSGSATTPAAIPQSTVDLSAVSVPKTPSPTPAFDIDDFLAQNEGLYRRLVTAEDTKEKRVLGAQFFEQPRQIGRGRVGKECLRLCRSRWSAYH